MNKINDAKFNKNRIMNEINDAIVLAMQQFENEHGKNAKLEEGDAFVTVFNDAVLIIGLENRQLGVKFIAGAPYKIDNDLNLTQ